MNNVFTHDREVDTHTLRKALGRFATGVVVVTSVTECGAIGMTINSFCSVSLAPPLVLFCVRHHSRLHAPLVTATAFAVNVLAQQQKELASRFAKPGIDRFGATLWRPGVTRSPVLRGVHAAMECLTERTVTVGDHDVVFGRVVATHLPAADHPLLFHGGDYRQIAHS